MLKVPKHFWNLLALLFGFSLSFIATWQLDLVVSRVIGVFYDTVKDWRFFIPIAPPFTWEGAFWFYPDAYVRFLMLMWLGFAIALIAALLWEKD